jgi:DNA-binding protein HU-beta
MAKAATKDFAKKQPAKNAAAPKANKAAATKATTAKASKAATKAPSKAAAKTPARASAKTTAKAPARTASKAGAAKGARTAATKMLFPILTLRHIAESFSTAHELPKRQANELVTQVVEMITANLKKGNKIRLSGLGILQVRKRAARMGRNPATGESIKIKASKKIAFRAAKELMEAI